MHELLISIWKSLADVFKLCHCVLKNRLKLIAFRSLFNNSLDIFLLMFYRRISWRANFSAVLTKKEKKEKSRDSAPLIHQFSRLLRITDEHRHHVQDISVQIYVSSPWCMICGLSLLLVLILAPRVFLWVLWFSPSTKTNWNDRRLDRRSDGVTEQDGVMDWRTDGLTE